ncbi:MAG: hypothetical protein HOP15_12850 [Planctomycetes bacterium]|nr:hypothetical protein [Planctomycetota bacterium]
MKLGAAPADDSLRVLALSEALDPRRVYGTSGVLDDLARGEKERVLGTATVQPDGSFELALGTMADAWLVIDGRFLYSARAEKVPALVERIELAHELGGCLAGRVTLPADVTDLAAALEDIDVELGPDAQDFSMGVLASAPLFNRRAELDAEGRFELRALPEGHSHALEIDADDFADAKKAGLVFEPGRVREAELALTRGATLRGVVRDESGAPLVGAAVKAAESAMFGFPGEELAEAKSDANGAFELAHVAAGKCLLLAKMDGYLDSEALKLELRDEEGRENLALVLARGASISGRVQLQDGAALDGDKLEGTAVQVSFDPAAMVGMGALNAARGGSGKTKCGPDGRFEVTGLGKGPFVVSASLERTAADGVKEPWRAKSESVKPDTHDLTLTLSAPSSIAGRVQDLAGAAVTKFSLRATPAGGAPFMPVESKQEACEDPEGDFVLRGLEPGKWKLAASADGFGPMTPLELTLPTAEASPLVLVLAPAATISGTVVDPGGNPVSGARVTLQADMTQRIQRMRDQAKAPEATSAEGGAFLLTGLAPGTSLVVAKREGFADSESLSVETSTEAPAQGVVLRLQKGALVTGEVYGPDGKPAAGAQILAQDPSTFEMSMKRADGAGLFRFEHMAPGAWTITAILEGGEVEVEGSAAEASASFLENMRIAMVTLEEGEEEHVVLGAPPKDPVRVRGTVRHGERPVGEGLVSFVGEGSKGLEAFKMASLGADGSYEAELGAPGRYLVTVQVTAGGGPFQQNSVEYSVKIPEAEEHVLDFALPLGAVRGTVRVPAGATPAGTRVTLAATGGIESGTLMGGQYAEATTDEAGRYAFDYLRPGSYAVAAGGALFGGAFGGKSQAGRLVRSGLNVTEGRALENVDFTLEEPGDIEGRVLDSAGQPIKDASLFVRDEHGQLLDRFSMITSGADGSFHYTGVAAGEYVVSARGKGLASVESAPVRVEKGASASVELVLYAGTRLVIEVVDEAGEALQARVSVLDERGREMQGMLGWAEMMSSFGEGGFDGSKQNVGPLPPGTYTVTAVAADGKKTSKPVTLDGQPERRMKLRLR